MKKDPEQIKDLQENVKKNEKKLLEKKKDRKSKKQKKEDISAQEKFIAPILLVLTLLVSYIVFLFKK